MQIKVASTLIAAALTALVTHRADAQSAAFVMTIEASGFRSSSGYAALAIYDGPHGFPESRALAAQFVPIVGGRATLQVVVPGPGVYAVAAYHDEDGNFQLNRTIFGNPSEGWAVSRGASSVLGPPSFQDAAFYAAGPGVAPLYIRY